MRKCPKCKSKNLQLIELWTHSITWDQTEEAGGLTSTEGDLNPGDPYRVDALCKQCNYAWRLRGVTQITDLYPRYFSQAIYKED
jgi:hypothetical protein